MATDIAAPQPVRLSIAALLGYNEQLSVPTTPFAVYPSITALTASTTPTTSPCGTQWDADKDDYFYSGGNAKAPITENCSWPSPSSTPVSNKDLPAPVYRILSLPKGHLPAAVFMPYTSGKVSRKITIGVELEMVVLNLKPSDGHVFTVVRNCLQKLCDINMMSAGAEIFIPHIDAIANRSKFLVMADNSINPRLKKTDKSLVSQDTNIPNIVTDFAHKGLMHRIAGEREMHEFLDYYKSIPFPKGYSSGSSSDGNHLGKTAITNPSGEVVQDGWHYFKDRGVKPEPVVEENEEDWIKGEPAEFCTPILAAKSWKWMIPTLFEHLNTHLDLGFNKSTGLHVHIGCGRGNKWSLLELKRIAQAVMIFEPVIDLVHAPHRSHQNAWSFSSSRYTPVLAMKTTLAAVSMIEQAGTLTQFLALVGAEKFHKYNFTCNETYGTVEFRQGDAHSDGDRVLAWVELIVSFVEAAISATTEEFLEWAAFIQSPADVVKLGQRVWDRFGIPVELMQRVTKEVLPRLKDEDMVWK